MSAPAPSPTPPPVRAKAAAPRPGALLRGVACEVAKPEDVFTPTLSAGLRPFESETVALNDLPHPRPALAARTRGKRARGAGAPAAPAAAVAPSAVRVTNRLYYASVEERRRRYQTRLQECLDGISAAHGQKRLTPAEVAALNDRFYTQGVQKEADTMAAVTARYCAARRPRLQRTERQWGELMTRIAPSLA